MESGNQNLMNMLLHGGSSENGSQQSLEGFGQQYSAPVSGHSASMQPPLTSAMGQQGSPYQMMPQSTMMQQGDMMSPPYSQSQTSYSDNNYQGYPGYTQQRMGHQQATSPMYYGQNGSFLSSLGQYGTPGRSMGQYASSSSSVGYGHQNYYSDVYQPKSPASHQQIPGAGYPLPGQMGVGGNGSSYPTGYGGQSSMSPLQKPLGQSFFPPRSPASQQIHSPPNMTTNFPGQPPTSPMTQPMVGHGPRRSSTSPVSSMVPQGVYSMPPQRPQYPATSTTMSQNQSSCMFAQRLEKMSAQHQYQAQMSSGGITGPSGPVVSPSRRTSFPNQQSHLPGMHPMKSNSGPVSPIQRSPPQIGKSSPPFKPMRSPPPYQAHKSPPQFQKTSTTMPAPYPPTSDVRKSERQPPPATPEIGQPPAKKARKSVNKEKSSMQKLEEVAESVSPHLAEGLSHAVGDPVNTDTKQPETNHKDGPEPSKEEDVTNLAEKPLTEKSTEETANLKDSDPKEGRTEERNKEKKSEENKNEEGENEVEKNEEKSNEEMGKEGIRNEERRNEDSIEKQNPTEAKDEQKESEDMSENKKDALPEKDKTDKSQAIEKSKDTDVENKDNSQTEPQNNESPSEKKKPDTVQQHKESSSPIKDEKKSPQLSQTTQETSKDNTHSSDKSDKDLDEPVKVVKATDTTKSGGTQTPRIVEKPSLKADNNKNITVSVKDVQPKTLLSKTMPKSPGTKVSISRSGHPPTIQATVIAKGQSAQSNQQVLVAKTAAGQMYLIQGNVLIPVQNITVQQPNGEKGNKVICVNQGQGKSSHVMVGNITPNLTQKTDKSKSNKTRYDEDSEDELRGEVDGKMEIDLACREKSLLSPTAEMADNEHVKSTVSSQTDNNFVKSRFARSEGESSRFHSMKSSPSAASKASNLEKNLNAIKAKLEQERHNQTEVVEVKKRIGRPPGSKDKHKRKSYLYKRPPEERGKPVDTSIVSSNEKGDHVSEKHKKPHAINVPTVSKTTRQTKRPKMIPPPLSPTRTLLVQPRGGLDGDKWVCSFCGKPSNHSSLGVLYGPYKAKLSRERSDSSRECRSPDKLLSPGSRIPELPTELEGNTIELWIHKDCGSWSQGVYMLGRSLYGLEQAVESAASHKCSKCMELGATLQCFKRGCNSIFHFACARDSGCAFVEENFTIFCSVHK